MGFIGNKKVFIAITICMTGAIYDDKTVENKGHVTESIAHRWKVAGSMCNLRVINVGKISLGINFT